MSSLAVGRAALLERAEMLLARGEPGPAIAALEALVSRYADDVAVLNALGEACRRDGQLPRAQDTFRRAVAAAPPEGPDAMAARTGLGLTLCEQHRFADALPPLRECVRLNPNLPATHYNLAMCLAALEDRPGAIAALREAVRVEPSFRQGYLALASLLADGGQPAEAAIQVRRALELDSDDPATAALLRRLDPSAP
jgi:Flp pilus assembly protein TadD